MGDARLYGKRGLGCLAVLLTVLLCMGLWTVTGCGGSGKGDGDAASTGETVQKQEADQDEDRASGQGGGKGGGRDGGKGSQSGGKGSQSGGSAEFSLDGQEIGSGNTSSDLRVTGISWADHGEYFSIVFEFKKVGGSDATAVPNCHTWYPDQYYVLAVSLDDIPTSRYDYPQFQEAVVPVQFGDPLVKSMFRWSTAAGEPAVFEVACEYSAANPEASSRPHRLTYQADPMRVILDIRKQ